MRASTDEFVLTASIRVFVPILSVLLIGFGAVSAIIVVSSDAPGAFASIWVLWFGAVVAQAWWHHFRTPQRIKVSDAGLSFVARRRVLDVPWDGLRTVVIPFFDFGRHYLVWRWDGGRLCTWRRFDGIDRLFRIVEEGPGAKVLV